MIVQPHFWGADPQKSVFDFYYCLAAHQVDNLGEVIPIGIIVISRNALNFVTIFDISIPSGDIRDQSLK